jgi:hypothetical protein
MITSSVKQLKSRFRGELIVQGDEQYDAARAVFNAAIDRRPALIARCAGPDAEGEVRPGKPVSDEPKHLTGHGHRQGCDGT